jgi:hypothetical protein
MGLRGHGFRYVLQRTGEDVLRFNRPLAARPPLNTTLGPRMKLVSRFSVLAVLALVVLGCASQPQRTQAEILQVARDAVAQVALWADSAEYGATRGMAEFGWLVAASCTTRAGRG